MLLCLEKAINHLSEVRGIPLVKPKQPSIARGASINDVVKNKHFLFPPPSSRGLFFLIYILSISLLRVYLLYF